MPNRYFCEVSDELQSEFDRTLNQEKTYTINRASILHWSSLLSEMTTMARRMEAALHDQKDYEKAHEKYKEMVKKVRKLEKKKIKLQKETKSKVDKPIADYEI